MRKYEPYMYEFVDSARRQDQVPILAEAERTAEATRLACRFHTRNARVATAQVLGFAKCYYASCDA